MDFYPLAAGSTANALGFLRAAILALQMILVAAVFLLSVAMLIMIPMLPVVKRVVVGP